MSLSLGAFLGQDVGKVGLTPLEFPFAGAAESLRSSPVGLHFRHYFLLIGLTRIEDHPRPKQAGRTPWVNTREPDSLFLWCKHHDELSTFHFRKLLDRTVFYEVFFDPL